MQLIPKQNPGIVGRASKIDISSSFMLLQKHWTHWPDNAVFVSECLADCVHTLGCWWIWTLSVKLKSVMLEINLSFFQGIAVTYCSIIFHRTIGQSCFQWKIYTLQWDVAFYMYIYIHVCDMYTVIRNSAFVHAVITCEIKWSFCQTKGPSIVLKYKRKPEFPGLLYPILTKNSKIVQMSYNCTEVNTWRCLPVPHCGQLNLDV